MDKKINDRKIVIINQASNYLTIGLANAFHQRFEDVVLITGSIHIQGEELHSGINVKRIIKWAERPARKKLISYLIALLQIYFLLLLKYRKHEVFFISLPPMGYLLNIILPHRFSMLIWDVFPDGLKITGMSEKHLVFRIWKKLNKRSFKKANKIFTIGNRMADLLSRYLDKRKLIITPIWSIFQNPPDIDKSNNPFIEQHLLQGKFIVQYSGNIGLSHGVEKIIDLAERLIDHEVVLFQIIGRGPRKEYIKSLVQRKALSNCQFLPFQSDEMFPYSLAAADLGIVVLDNEVSKGSVPSKSYNLMSYGIPSLYLAADDSELNDYANKFNHAKCFNTNQLNEAGNFILELALDKQLRESYSNNAILASRNFQRKNADKIVSYYLDSNYNEV